MILLFLQLLVGTCNEFDVSFEPNKSNLWETSSQNSEYDIFKIQQTLYKYIYVSVFLLKPDSQFILCYGMGVKNLSTYDSLPDENIDFISIYENKNTRFLKIEPNQQPVTIQIFNRNTLGSYLIKILHTNETKCDNDCYGQGVCGENGCNCKLNRVGATCHQAATLIKDIAVTIGKEFQFFSLILSEYKGQNVKIQFMTDLDEGLFIYLEKTNILYLPYENDFDAQLVNQSYFNSQQQISYKAQIPEELELNSRIVFATKIASRKTIPLDPIKYINISCQVIEQDNDVEISTAEIMIIVFSILGALLVFIFPFCLIQIIRRNREKKLKQEQGNPCPINIQHHSEVAEKLNQINKEGIIITEECCSICLESLLNSQPVVQTNCKHKFHNECITLWKKNHKDCPICRTLLT